MKLLLLCVILVGCTKPNPNFCADNPNGDCRVDAPFACNNNDDCAGMPARAVCEQRTRTCVQCTSDSSDACSDTTPICMSSNECGACSKDADCASSVCLPSGACAVEASVLYAAVSGGDTAACTETEPCSLAHAVTVADSARNVVRLAPGTYTFATTFTINKPITLFGRDAVIDHDGTDGSTLAVGANGNLSLYYVTVLGGTGPYGRGIETNAESAVLYAYKITIRGSQSLGIFSSGSLTVIASRFELNSGGGIAVSGLGKFKIVGNVFWVNGGYQSGCGGVCIAGISGADNRLEFNSFARNSVPDGIAAAINCYGPFTARNNIMSLNGTSTNMEQVMGSCKHAYSIVRPGSLPDGPGNSASDPLFVDVTLAGDLHLMSGSPAVGAADPSSDLDGITAQDADGDVRSWPADMGADEVP